MKVEKVNQPAYRLTLTGEEMGELWDLMYSIAHEPSKYRSKDYNIATKLYHILEDARPGGGFDQ